ncbi:MAG: hypothetical protein SVK08_12035, partial [Halobacteriota archaeon]|nr:hypothetical protein [Halobacteriota archaeon]
MLLTLIALSVITPVTAGTTWFVDDGSVSNFTTIQAVIDTVSAGDTMVPYTSSGNMQNGGDFLPLIEVSTPTPTPTPSVRVPALTDIGIITLLGMLFITWVISI